MIKIPSYEAYEQITKKVGENQRCKFTWKNVIHDVRQIKMYLQQRCPKKYIEIERTSYIKIPQLEKYLDSDLLKIERIFSIKKKLRKNIKKSSAMLLVHNYLLMIYDIITCHQSINNYAHMQHYSISLSYVNLAQNPPKSPEREKPCRNQGRKINPWLENSWRFEFNSLYFISCSFFSYLHPIYVLYFFLSFFFINGISI